MRKLDPALHERLITLINSMGYDLVGCEIGQQDGQQALRVFIDSLEESEKKGVTLDDCSQVSRQVGAMLDVDNPIQGRYVLEVSSPGIDRPLFELRHYHRHIGSEVKIRLSSPINQRRQFKGRLQRVEGENIYIQVEDSEESVVLPFSAIEKANVVGEVNVRKTETKKQKADR
jgi:ribosome maturation factor RimP